jgi:hypothetical protein
MVNSACSALELKIPITHPMVINNSKIFLKFDVMVDRSHQIEHAWQRQDE